MMCSIVKVQERGGAERCGRSFLLQNVGQKSNGRGVQLRVPLSSVHRVSPSPLQYKYIRCGSRQGGPGGEAAKAPPRDAGSVGNAKSGVERKTQHRPKNQSVTQ